MEKLFPANIPLAEKISYYHLLFFLASLPFDRFYSHIVLISFIIHSLFNFKKGQENRIPVIQFLALISVFLVTVLSTIYTSNKQEAFDDWGRQITTLLFPIVFWFSGFDLKKYREPLLLGFSLVCVATVGYLYLNALYVIHYFGLPVSAILSKSFLNHNFSQPIDMHATFFSMQLTIAVMYLISVLVNEKQKGYQWIYLGCILVLVAGIIQLSSKSVLFCLLIAVDILTPLYLLNGRRRNRFIFTACTITLIGIVALLSIPRFNDRLVGDLKLDLTEVHKGGQNEESRLTRWAIVTQIITDAPILGHGAGSEVSLLHEAFWTRQYYNSFLYHLNAHNEYLSFLVSSGVIGLLVYLITLTMGFNIAIKRKDHLFLLFMILIAIISFSEDITAVDKGVIFYAFFFSFFLFGSRMPVLKENELIK